MKLNLILAAIALNFGFANSTITYPSAVFEKLDQIEPLITNYHIYKEGDASLGRFVELFQQMNPLITKDVHNETIEVITKGVARLSSLDSGMKETLSKEKENSCILSLKIFLDQIIEQSGFAVSNCLEISDPSVFIKTSDYLEDLRETIKQIRKLPLVMIKPFIGRNVFTQAKEIADRIQELYNLEVSDDEETFARLLEKINIFTIAWQDEHFAVKLCVEDIEQSMKNAHAAIKAQLIVCRSFNGRAR